MFRTEPVTKIAGREEGAAALAGLASLGWARGKSRGTEEVGDVYDAVALALRGLGEAVRVVLVRQQLHLSG